MSLPSYLVLGLTVSAMLTGLIWTIQLVHYPSFAFVEAVQFPSFHAFHSQRITFIVAPLMLVEVALALWGVWQWPQEKVLWAAGLLVVVIWLSTLFLQIPLHHRLGLSQDLSLVEKLVTGNWIRTLAWSLKTLLLAFAVLKS